MKKIEGFTSGYWEISHALRGVAPETVPISSQVITMEKALRYLGKAEQHLDPERILAQVIHELKFDLIEGNTQWREEETEKISSKLIPFTTR